MSFRWRVLEVDLAQPLEELALTAGFDGVHLIFHLAGVRLGHSAFLASQLPLSPAQVASHAARVTATAVGDRLLDDGFRSALPGLPVPPARDPEVILQKLRSLGRPLEMLACLPAEDRSHSSKAASISVVVCTRNRPDSLRRCLHSLQSLTEPPLEILVVDNAPANDAAQTVTREFPDVRYLREPTPGLSTARNMGLENSRGSIVAFADDDVIVDANWTRSLRSVFRDPLAMVATGLVLPAELETRAQLIFEHHLRYFHLGYRRRRFDLAYFESLKNQGVMAWSIGAGANMAIRRRAYEWGYRFDTRLGPGVFGGCGEDSEFWYRLLADGWHCIYDPTAAVYHFHRRDLDDLRRLVKEYMKGHVAALLLQFFKTGHRGNLWRLAVGLPKHYLLVFAHMLASSFALEDRIEFAGLAGAIAGLRFAFVRKAG